MFVFIASLWWFVCCFTGYFNTLCVLFNSKSSARVQHVSFLPADITRGTCCLKFNTQHVLFCLSTLRLLCQNSMRRVLSPTFKQHGPCVETTSRQDNTHYVPQATHWCAESTSSHVLYCPHCVKITHEMKYKCCYNTCSIKQHMMGTLMRVIFSTWLFLQL